MKKSVQITKAHIVRSLFTAGIMLAISLTLSCSSDDGNGGDPGGSSGISSSSVVSSSSESSECGGVAYDHSSQICHYGKAKSYFTDERDGKKYVFTRISKEGSIYDPRTYDQTWMAENLNFNASGSKCYNEIEANCDKYGRLYNWATAMNSSASSAANPSGVKGVCPEGWHLPSAAEWTALTDAIVGTGANTAGTKLKANSDLWSINTGTDDFGFSALPGGGFNTVGNQYGPAGFVGVGGSGGWWSATEGSASTARFWLTDERANDIINSVDDKVDLFSVRCVQD